MSAVYDTLMRSEGEEWVPQLAESLSHNDDFTEFTLTLRDGVTFSDDSALDADAVKWSIDRYAASNFDLAPTWSDVVQEMSALDDSTVMFTLKDSWDNFPMLLSAGPGMIVGEDSEAGGSFTPMGAGPFTVENFAQNEELLLAARPDYFAGKPPLDAVRFVPSTSAQEKLDSLKAGQMNMTYILGDEAVIKETQDADYSGYLDLVGMGSLGLINNREGHPGADVRVRQAIAYGVDPEAVNSRINNANGLGIGNSEILPENSRWYNDTEGIAFDPEKAKTLLDEAKADGYDGKLKYVAYAEPRAQASALASQAALNSIGFDVTIDTAGSVNDFIQKIYMEQDYDMARSSSLLIDEAPYQRLNAALASDSQNNSGGYKDAEMDQLLSDVKTALTADAKRDAISNVQIRINETSPFAVWGPQKVLVAWDKNVHGVKRNLDNIILLDTVWIESN